MGSGSTAGRKWAFKRLMPKAPSLMRLPNPTFGASVASMLEDSLQPAGLRENSSSRSPGQALSSTAHLARWGWDSVPPFQTMPLNTMNQGA